MEEEEEKKKEEEEVEEEEEKKEEEEVRGGSKPHVVLNFRFHFRGAIEKLIQDHARLWFLKSVDSRGYFSVDFKGISSNVHGNPA